LIRQVNDDRTPVEIISNHGGRISSWPTTLTAQQVGILLAAARQERRRG
jgi:hypothetical protein